MSKSLKMIISITAVILLIGGGLLTYFLIANKKTDIFLTSYDKEKSFFIASVKKAGVSYAPDNTGMNIANIDAGSFIENIILKSDYYLKSYIENGRTIYLLKCDDYLFGLYKAKLEDGEEYIKISYFMKFTGTGPDLILFPNTNLQTSSLGHFDINKEGNENKIIPWDFLPTEFNSYEKLKTFYMMTNTDRVQIDDANKTICVTKYEWFGWVQGSRVSSDFPAKFQCTEDGIIYSLKDPHTS